MKKLISILISALSATCSSIFATPLTINGEPATIDTIFHATVGPGVTTTGVRINGRSNVFYSTIDLTNPDLALRGVQALDREQGSESVGAMGTRKNRLGETVYMAGVNGDFANLNGAEKLTNGPALIDGTLYSHGVGDKGWKSFSSQITVSGNKDITISSEAILQLPLKFPNGNEYNMTIDGSRDEDCLILYTPRWGSSTKTNVWGMECTMRLISGSTAEGDAVFEVTSAVTGDITNNPANGNMAIPTDGYVLSGVGKATWQMSSLKLGDRLRLQKPRVFIGGNIADVNTLIGGCPIIVSEGKPIDAARATELNNATKIQTTPTARTAIGYNSERTKLILLVVDSHTTNEHSTGDHAAYGSTSTGFDFPTLAQTMIYLGCDRATAMDGGGSSQLYNNELGVRNLPYGKTSYLRPVSNGFFAVSTVGADDDEIAYMEVVQKNVHLTNGQKFTPTVYGYNKFGVLVNTNVSDYTLSVDPSLGSTAERTFTAGSKGAVTHGIVSRGEVKCGVRILLNGGGNFVSSGNDDAPLEVTPPYRNNGSAGIDDIDCENTSCSSSKTVYYNLQGQPTANPARGFYIEVTGSKARKVFIR